MTGRSNSPHHPTHTDSDGALLPSPPAAGCASASASPTSRGKRPENGAATTGLSDSNGNSNDQQQLSRHSKRQRQRGRPGRSASSTRDRIYARDDRLAAAPGKQQTYGSIYGGAVASGQAYYSEYDHGGDDGDDSASLLSHVSLDQAPTYGRLVAAHVLSLLPCLALFLASVMLAWHAPCHIRAHPEDRAAERKACRRVLSDRVSLSAFGVGIVSWLAAYALRPALWKIMETSLFLGRSALEAGDNVGVQSQTYSQLQHEQQPWPRERAAASPCRDNFATVVFVLLKTIALEMLRIFSVLLVNALVIAGLVRTPYWHGDGSDAQRPYARATWLESGADAPGWHLHWYDPRFTVGVWLAIGWAMTEFIVTSWQMFDRLALYEVDFAAQDNAGALESGLFEDEMLAPEEAYFDEPTAERERLPTLRSASETDATADYSDSAATVRGFPAAKTGTGQQENGSTAGVYNSEDDDTSAPSSAHQTPNARLIAARQRVLARAEESCISIAPSDRVDAQQEQGNDLNAAHWTVLREKLDAEMDSLQKARSRVELEQTFGQPLTSVPIVLCTLWRIDGWLWNLGSTLLMSASVTLAQGPLVEDKHTAAPQLFPPLRMSMTTLLGLVALHTMFTSMWTLALPRLGFAAVTYTSMLVGVALCVAAWGRWGLLV